MIRILNTLQLGRPGPDLRPEDLEAIKTALHSSCSFGGESESAQLRSRYSFDSILSPHIIRSLSAERTVFKGFAMILKPGISFTTYRLLPSAVSTPASALVSCASGKSS